MSIQDFVTKLQNLPYQSRVKILWGTVGVMAVLLIVLWVINLKSSIGGEEQSGTDSGQNTAENIQNDVSYASVEWVESSSTNFKIFFNFNNTTDDILNVSSLSDIELNYNDSKINPTKILDRQGSAFVEKVLSHTQKFGVLVFPPLTAQKGELTFNQMFFDQKQSDFLTQTLKLDFKELKETDKLRN
jgi:hypothetical protein